MNKQQIDKMIVLWQNKADNAYMRYQDTGIARYDRERRIAEDVADALRIAANAADEHLAFLNLKTEVLSLAVRAERGTITPEDVISLACSYGYKRTERVKDGYAAMAMEMLE